jgi:hypothetical protein
VEREQQAADDRLGGSTPGTEAPAASGLLGPLRNALTQAAESDRYRLLAELFAELANDSRGGANGRALAEQLEEITRRHHALQEERAALNDSLSVAQAELANREERLSAEQKRASELQRVIEDQRARLSTLQKQFSDAQTELVARNAELHQIRVEAERHQLKAQRAELEVRDRSKFDALEARNSELSKTVEKLQSQYEALRAEKNGEIEALQASLEGARASASGSGEALLVNLWHRLAAAKPPLSEGDTAPNAQAAERLIGALIEFVAFADAVEKGMRAIVGNGRYTKDRPRLKTLWENYSTREELPGSVRQTVAPKGGKPTAVLKMRLRLPQSWTLAAMIANDSTIESIAAELQSHLMGPAGAGSDANRKIRDYIRQDGHVLFLEHLRALRNQKLEELLGR